jgi:hypothetical protein
MKKKEDAKILTTETLKEIVPLFFENDQEAKVYSKIADKHKTNIKAIMTANNMQEFEIEGIKASCTISERESFIEEALINKIKGMVDTKDISTSLKNKLIKKREYVDMDTLEDAIYNKKIKAEELAACQEKKEVITLKVAKIKEKK